MRYFDENTSETVRSFKCEDIEQNILVDEGLRQKAIDAYMSQTASSVVPHGGSEEVGEAQQKLFLTLFCLAAGVAAGWGALYSCERSSDPHSCGIGSTAGATALAIACAVF